MTWLLATYWCLLCVCCYLLGTRLGYRNASRRAQEVCRVCKRHREDTCRACVACRDAYVEGIVHAKGEFQPDEYDGEEPR